VHAICRDTTLLEVSQSSDITYRIYDYNRKDKGELRELHIEKALDVISFPNNEVYKNHNSKFFIFAVVSIIMCK
jgi:mannose-6-phosphate isomerase